MRPVLLQLMLMILTHLGKEKVVWDLKTQESLKLQTTSKIVNLCVASHVGSVTVAAETGGFARLPWQQQALLLDLFLEQLLLNPLRSSVKA
ncbi:unnamed protein product [Sphagnum troendelagicum]|uniref:Secreted protein n=1 Tax=Sphagnum troendelagicum TaxID=128251 RepID=A0ABP0UTH4_9BRYO